MNKQLSVGLAVLALAALADRLWRRHRHNADHGRPGDHRRRSPATTASESATASGHRRHGGPDDRIVQRRATSWWTAKA